MTKPEVTNPNVTKPRIVLVNRYFFPDQSATAQLLSDLAFHLSRAGHDVHVVASQNIYKDSTRLLASYEVVDGVAIFRPCRARFARFGLAGRTADYALTYFAFIFWVSGLLRRGDFLVAKTDPPLLSVALAPVAALRRARLVNWFQDIYPEVAALYGMPFVSMLSPALSWLRDVSVRRASCNIAIGERMREKLIRSGADEQRLKKIENWCDDVAIRPIARGDNTLAQQWGVHEKFIVIYSGNLGLAHDELTIVDAADRLQANKNILFLFVGGGARLKNLRDQVAKRGLETKFLFKPYQSEALLNLSLGVGDVHLVSLRPEMEGLITPSKFYGACAAGRPVIFVGDLDGEIARQVKHHNSGFSVALGDGAALANTIRTLASDPDLCARLGRNARAMIDGGKNRAAALAAWTQIFEG